MGELETRIVSQVVEKTQSELILFMIILVIAMLAVVLPLYIIMSRDKRAKNELENIRQDKYIVREAQIIEVIKENSGVIAGLKATLEANGIAMLERQDRIDERIAGAIRAIDKVYDRVDKAAQFIDEIRNRHFYKGDTYEDKAV